MVLSMAAEGQVDESAVENMLVASIESLYSEDDYEPDIRKGLLRIILQILQRHGKPSPIIHPGILSLLSVCSVGTPLHPTALNQQKLDQLLQTAVPVFKPSTKKLAGQPDHSQIL